MGLFPAELAQHGHVCQDNLVNQRLNKLFDSFCQAKKRGWDNLTDVGHDFLAAFCCIIGCTFLFGENAICEVLKVLISVKDLESGGSIRNFHQNILG